MITPAETPPAGTPKDSPYPDNKKDQSPVLKQLVGGLAVTTAGLLIATIVLATNKGPDCGNDANNANTGVSTTEGGETEPATVPIDTATTTDVAAPIVDEEAFSFLNLKSTSSFYDTLEANTCAGAKLQADNAPCVDLNVPQAGANVTKGYVGNLDMGDVVPNTKPYFQSKMCPVNVHWHLGSEHYSYGEFDEMGDGPHGNQPRPNWANRDLAEGEVRDGFRCRHYDATDEKFTKPYEWKYCVGMEVGETYEVHW